MTSSLDGGLEMQLGQDPQTTFVAATPMMWPAFTVLAIFGIEPFTSHFKPKHSLKLPCLLPQRANSQHACVLLRSYEVVQSAFLILPGRGLGLSLSAGIVGHWPTAPMAAR